MMSTDEYIVNPNDQHHSPTENQSPKESSVIGNQEVNNPNESSIIGNQEVNNPNESSILGNQEVNNPNESSIIGNQEVNNPKESSIIGNQEVNNPKESSIIGNQEVNNPNESSLIGNQEVNNPIADQKSTGGSDVLQSSATSTAASYNVGNITKCMLGALSQETLKEEAQLLCDRFAANGEEAIFLVISTKESVTSYQGTQLGMSFLAERSDIMDDFVQFCDDSQQEKISTFRTRKCSVPDSKVVSTMTKNTQYREDGQRSRDNQSGSHQTIIKSRKRLKEDEPQENMEAEPHPKKIARRDFTVPNESDLEHYNDEDSVGESDFFEPAENLPRSSRKIRMPAWCRGENDFVFDFSWKKDSKKTGEEKEQRSAIPKFSLEGKFMKLDECGSDPVTRYTCLQCRAVLLENSLKRHWSNHLAENGNFPCKRCDNVYKKVKYLEMHVAIDHDYKVYQCDKCDQVFIKNTSLEQHISMVHNKTRSSPIEESKPYCNICQRAFAGARYYKQHMGWKHRQKIESTIPGITIITTKSKGQRSKVKHLGKEEGDAEEICSGSGVSTPASGKRKKLSTSKVSDSISKVEDGIFESSTENEKMDIKGCYIKLEDIGDTLDLKDRQCKVCFNKFSSISSLANHMLHHKRPEVICNICHKNCATKFRLREHMRNHKEKLKCNLCDSEFVHRRNLRRHLSIYHFSNFCDACSSIVAIDGMEDHLKVCKLPPGVLRCDRCFKLFKKPISLKIHMENHKKLDKKLKKPGQKSYQKKGSICQICCKRFEDSLEVVMHVKTTHPDYMVSGEVDTARLNMSWKCKLCQQEFRTEDSFALHQASHRPRNYACELCNAKFSKVHFLNLHKKGHFSEAPHKCGVCNKGFFNKTSLNTHLQIHRDFKEFACHKCGKAFRQKATLRSHLRVHNQNFWFPCKYCDKRFRCKGSLRSHWLVRHPDKDLDKTFPVFHCEICGKKYAERSKYKYHLASHSGKKTHMCNKCSAAFSSSGALRYHQNMVHINKSFFCTVCKVKCVFRSQFLKHIASDTHVENCKKVDISPHRFFRLMDMLDQCQELDSDLILVENRTPFEKRRNMHSNLDFACYICGLKFLNASLLYQHRKKNHTFCLVCFQKFRTSKLYLMHLLSHKHAEECKKNDIDVDKYLKGLVKDETSSTNILIEMQKDRRTRDKNASKTVTNPVSQVTEKIGHGDLEITNQLLDHQYLCQEMSPHAASNVVTMEATSDVGSAEAIHFVEIPSSVAQNLNIGENDIDSPYALKAEMESNELLNLVDAENSPLDVNVTSTDDNVEYVVITIPNNQTVLSDNDSLLL